MIEMRLKSRDIFCVQLSHLRRSGYFPNILLFAHFYASFYSVIQFFSVVLFSCHGVERDGLGAR